MLKSLLIVGAGSCLGGMVRYLVSKVVTESVSSLFPWGTFCVNIVGCFLIGLIYGLVDRNIPISPEMRLFLTVGFCGGFTTFSTFAHENYLLFDSSRFPIVLLYMAVSCAAGFAAAWAGHFITR